MIDCDTAWPEDVKDLPPCCTCAKEHTSDPCKCFDPSCGRTEDEVVFSKWPDVAPNLKAAE